MIRKSMAVQGGAIFCSSFQIFLIGAQEYWGNEHRPPMILNSTVGEKAWKMLGMSQFNRFLYRWDLAEPSMLPCGVKSP